MDPIPYLADYEDKDGRLPTDRPSPLPAKPTPEDLPLIDGKVRNEARLLAGPVSRHNDDKGTPSTTGASHGCVEVQNVLQSLEGVIASRNHYAAQLAQAQKERDEARAERDLLRELAVKEVDGILEYTPKQYVIRHADHPWASLALTCAKLNHTLASLTATNAGLLRDKERLDWLEKVSNNSSAEHKKWVDVNICGPKNHGGKPENWLVSIEGDHDTKAQFEGEGPSLRSAIDAAALTPPTSPATQPPCT